MRSEQNKSGLARLLLTLPDDRSQRFTIFGILCDRLAEIERLPCPIVHRECQMMGSDSTSDGGAEAFYGFDCLFGCGVFEHDTKARKVLV